jgi:hypothetical protein
VKDIFVEAKAARPADLLQNRLGESGRSGCCLASINRGGLAMSFSKDGPGVLLADAFDREVLNCSPSFYNEPMIRLSELIARHSGLHQARVCPGPGE